MPRLRRLAASALVLSLALATTACVAPLVVGAGATAGYVGLQNRPVGQTAEDTKLKVQIKDNLSRIGFRYFADVGIDVFYGDVLLTGVLPSQYEGEQVVDIVRRTPGVNRVYNELFIGAVYSASLKAKDAWIAAQLKPRLLADSSAYPLNYITSVVNGHIYIMGSAGSQAEREHVLHLLGSVGGVKKVHDYLVIAGKQEAGKPSVPASALDNIQRREPNPLSESGM